MRYKTVKALKDEEFKRLTGMHRRTFEKNAKGSRRKATRFWQVT
jgi:hypothetical protein